MSILSGPAILEAVKDRHIIIDPFDEKYINPASIDLRLGSEVVQYEDRYLDARLQARTRTGVIDKMGFCMQPGELYLMHTLERVHTLRYVPVLDGKSSIGRLGICCHLTAGFGDPGYNGQYTLEVTCVQPVRIYRGMRFCQMRFHQISGELMDYQTKGHYVGEASMGPVPSMSWKQFREK